jgi:hypothetical protein
MKCIAVYCQVKEAVKQWVMKVMIKKYDMEV